MLRLGSVPRVGLLGAILGGLACGGGGGGMQPPPPPPPPPPMCVSGTGGTPVAVRDNQFDPATVSVALGGRVTWTWSGVASHNVTFETGPQLPAESCDQTSGTHNVTFTTAGTYGYTCTNHANMNGSVTVTP